MELSIVIVNWNSREYLRKCLESIFRNTQGVQFEVVAIDSGSFDGCDRMLAECYPQVKFIQSAANLGFARANNVAAAESRGDCLLFLNPDTEIVGNAVGAMCAAMRALPDVGVLGCRLLNSDGTLQSSCIQPIPTIVNQLLGVEAFRRRWPRKRLWGMAALYHEGTEPREVEGVSGACLMVRRATFERVGRFTDEYFMYAEDLDLSYKVRQAGRRNYYVPTATVIHHGGSSSEQAASAFATVMMREAVWRFRRRTRGRAYAMAYRVAMLGSAAGRLALLGPAWLAGRGSAAARAKWLAILRWTVGRDGIVASYYGR
jgi:N-acetylglucosaminyl-diphospho-decaprenol L-rhamnosyltransferase